MSPQAPQEAHRLLSILMVIILAIVIAVMVAGGFIFGWWLRENAIHGKARAFDPSTMLRRPGVDARMDGEGEIPFRPTPPPDPFTFAGVTDKYEKEVQGGALSEEDFRE